MKFDTVAEEDVDEQDDIVAAVVRPTLWTSLKAGLTKYVHKIYLCKPGMPGKIACNRLETAEMAFLGSDVTDAELLCKDCKGAWGM